MKKLIMIALAIVMIVSLAACKGSENGNNRTNPPASSTGDNQPSGNESGGARRNRSRTRIRAITTFTDSATRVLTYRKNTA